VLRAAADAERSIRDEIMIKLMDLIGLAGVKLGKFKIHCATGVNPTPLEAFYDGTFKDWQEYQNQKNFQCEHVVSLIYLRNSEWLFAGIYEVLGVQRRTREKNRGSSTPLQK